MKPFGSLPNAANGAMAGIALAPSPEADAEGLLDHCESQVLALVRALVPAGGPPKAGRTVMFVAAEPGSGTSTIAAAYARSHADVTQRRVVLLEVDRRGAAPSGQAVPAGRGAVDGRPPRSRPVDADRLVAGAPPVEHWQLSASAGRDVTATAMAPELWSGLRQQFDEIVVDCPAAARSPLFALVGPLADAVVIVLQADGTRAPVAERLVADLRGAGAPVVGAVLNRRRFYIPTGIYGRL
jgi:protein-tyrosine kinase